MRQRLPEQALVQNAIHNRGTSPLAEIYPLRAARSIIDPARSEPPRPRKGLRPRYVDPIVGSGFPYVPVRTQVR